jgi:hypothetical protein
MNTPVERMLNLEARNYRHYKFMRAVFLFWGIFWCLTIVGIPFGGALLIKAKSIRVQQEQWNALHSNAQV